MNTIDAILFEPVGCLADAEGCVYADAAPALAELKTLGITLIVASSLSRPTLTCLLDDSGLSGLFDHVHGRSADGHMSETLRDALTAAGVVPDKALFVTDTAAGLQAAREAGVHGILMMNDPDEAMKLTAHKPAGGIVSLHELPDFVRFVSATSRI